MVARLHLVACLQMGAPGLIREVGDLDWPCPTGEGEGITGGQDWRR